jgi:hypothetical protein
LDFAPRSGGTDFRASTFVSPKYDNIKNRPLFALQLWRFDEWAIDGGAFWFILSCSSPWTKPVLRHRCSAGFTSSPRSGINRWRTIDISC